MKRQSYHAPSLARQAGRPVRTLSAALLLVAAALLVPARQAAQETARKGARQAPEQPDRESELAAIRAEIAALDDELRRLGEWRRGVAGELERTGLELRLQERRVAEARAERRLAERRLADGERRARSLEKLLVESRELLRRRLIDLYRRGGSGSLRLLLSIRSDDHLLPGIRILRYLALREAASLAEYVERRGRLARERRDLEEGREVVERWIQRQDERLAELRQLELRQQALLDELERRRTRVGDRSEALVDKERKLSNFLDFLYGRTPQGLEGTPIQEFRGVLDRPVEGPVVTGFGPRVESRYGTRVPHNGIDIAPGAAVPVRAVYPGRVVFAAPFEGYGPTVILHHPTRVFTLYAGLAGLRVAADDVLSLGAVLGDAGERLYFEIRVENRPEDPLEWLR